MSQQALTIFHRLWDLRRDARGGVRLAWWVAALLVCSLVVWSPTTGPPVIALWVVTNLLLVIGAGLWAVTHLRILWSVHRTVFGWSFALALVIATTQYSYLELLFVDSPEIPDVIRRTAFAFALSAALGLFAVLLILFIALGFIGAALFALVTLKRLPSGEAVVLGVKGWWTAMLIAAVPAVILSEQSSGAARISAAATIGLPVWSIWVSSVISRPAYDPQRLSQRFLQWVYRKLVFRRVIGGRPRTFDARGAILGIVASSFALLLATTSLFLPLQARTLGWLLRARNQLSADVMPAANVTLLTMDAHIRNVALTEQSEAALQAEAIRRLSHYDITRIVLQPPIVASSEDLVELDAGRSSLSSREVLQAARSNLRDLPELEQAIRQAGNVTLVLPRSAIIANREEPLSREDSLAVRAIGRLVAAAREVGALDLDSFALTHLPAIPIASEMVTASPPGRWRRPESVNTPRLPVPLLLLAASRNEELVVRLDRTQPDVAEVSGRKVPLMASGRALVNFVTSGNSDEFPRIAYSSLLAMEVTDRPPSRSTSRPRMTALHLRELLSPDLVPPEVPLELVPPELLPPELFAAEAADHRLDEDRGLLSGRVVFLDTLIRGVRATPMGVIPVLEVLAHATEMMLSGRFVTRCPGWIWILTTLALGMLIGQGCSKRDPLAAGWLTLSVVVLVAAAALFVFIVRSLWYDPVVPALAINAAYLLVNQFTFSLERAEQRRLSAMVELRDEAVREVAHELRNPLAVVQSSAATVLHGMNRGLPQSAQREMLELCVETCKRFTRLLNNMLDTARLQAGRAPELRMQKTDLAELVKSLIASQKVSTSGHRLIAELKEDPCLVSADGDKIYQVLSNLVDNAVKYSPDGGEVRVGLWRENGEVRLSVADRGIGMTAPQQQRLFQPFERVLDPNRKIAGTGIGLHLAKRLVEAHGGRIWLESAYGQGTTFYVALPATPDKVTR